MVVRSETLLQKMKLQPLGPLEICWGAVWQSRAWSHMDFTTDCDVHDEDSIRVFSFIPGTLHAVQKAELSGVIISLQAFVLCHSPRVIRC